MWGNFSEGFWCFSPRVSVQPLSIRAALRYNLFTEKMLIYSSEILRQAMQAMDGNFTIFSR
jgi:hypothetical protein